MGEKKTSLINGLLFKRHQEQKCHLAETLQIKRLNKKYYSISKNLFIYFKKKVIKLNYNI